MVDAGRHDLDPFGYRAVVRHKLLALGLGRREHEVGAVDDVVLNARALLGVVVDARVGLYARERVEGRHHRQVAPVLQLVRHRARQPVVAV